MKQAIQDTTSLFEMVNCDSAHHVDGHIRLTNETCEQLKGYVYILSENDVSYGFTKVLNDGENKVYLESILEFEKYNCIYKK